VGSERDGVRTERWDPPRVGMAMLRQGHKFCQETGIGIVNVLTKSLKLGGSRYTTYEVVDSKFLVPSIRSR
jgi:hypothetical protein